MLFRYLFLCLCFFPFASLYAATYAIDGDIIGQVGHYKVKKKDTLHAIARQFDVGIVELLATNPGITPQSLKAGSTLTIPSMHILPSVRNGIVLNLSELRLYYFPDEHTVMTFPVGIGREGWETPTGSTVVVMKRKDPVWIPPASIREEEPDLPEKVPPGPKNPLGAYALNLGMPGYRIHGTSTPSSIGKRTSHGCIRMYPEDIEVLFNAVSQGTSVVITDTLYKLGWQDKRLFLQVMPTPRQADAIAKYQSPSPEILIGIEETIRHVAAEHITSINWETANEAIAAHMEVPTAIGRRM